MDGCLICSAPCQTAEGANYSGRIWVWLNSNHLQSFCKNWNKSTQTGLPVHWEWSISWLVLSDWSSPFSSSSCESSDRLMLPTSSLFSDMTSRGERIRRFIKRPIKEADRQFYKNYPHKEEKGIHLHLKRCWPLSPDGCLSGLSSQSLCLTRNQSAYAWGLKTCHPLNCPYLDL